MFSWKATRRVCGALLLLPLVHLAILLLRDGQALRADSPVVWQPEVEAYVRHDERMQLPEDPLVAVGGRRLALWRNLEGVVAPLPLIARPLGQAVVEDILHYEDRLISFYSPDAVLLLPDNSEFRGRDDKSASEFAAAVLALVEECRNSNYNRQFYVFSPVKTPAYPDDHATMDQATRLLRAAAEADPGLTVIDPNPLLAGANGKPAPRYFWSDGVQLTQRGYDRLALLLRRQLQDHPGLPAPPR